MEQFWQMIDPFLPLYLFEKLKMYIGGAFLIGVITGWLSCDAGENKVAETERTAVE